MAAEFARAVLRLQPTDTLLDFGCGRHGGVAAELLQDVKAVVAVDADAAAVHSLNVRFAEQGFTPTDAVAVTLDALASWPNRFDAAVASFVFHHIDAGMHSETLQQLFEALKPGCALAVFDLQQVEGVNGIKLAETAMLARSAGFRVEFAGKWRKCTLPRGRRAQAVGLCLRRPTLPV